MIRIEIETSNAAFESGGAELARILRELANDVETEDSLEVVGIIFLYDVNGNHVGRLVASED